MRTSLGKKAFQVSLSEGSVLCRQYSVQNDETAMKNDDVLGEKSFFSLFFLHLQSLFGEDHLYKI